MTGYLLDTMAVSEGRKRRPHAGFATWLGAQEPNQLFLSVLTVGEIQYGISRLPENSERRQILSRWLVDGLIPEFGDRILPFDARAALAWGDFVGNANLRGFTLPAIDAQIGATAKLHGLTLVTRSVRPFASYGVKSVDPWSD